MTWRHCTVCGRPFDHAGERCRECRLHGRQATALWCVCDRPKAQRVKLLGHLVVDDAYECEHCGRPVLTGE